MTEKEKLLQLIDWWFLSDLDIAFGLKKGRQTLWCTFENDAWYEHINDARRGVTIKSIRHNGSHRRFICVEGSDSIYEQVKQYCHKLYTITELKDVVEDLASNFTIIPSD